MKRFLSFFKNSLALLLVILTSIFMILYIVLNVSERLISRQNIIDTVKSVDIVDLIGEENKQEIYSILEKANVPTEYIDIIMEDEKIKEEIGEYVSLSLEYMLFEDKKMPVIDEKEITDILITSFDRVIEEAEKYNVEVDNYISKEEQELIHEKIEYYVPEVVEKISVAQDFIEDNVSQSPGFNEVNEKIKQIKKAIDIVELIYSYKNLLLVGVFVPLVLIILLKWRKFRFVKWLAFPFIFVAAFLKVIYEIIPYLLDTKMPSEFYRVEAIIEPSINKFLSGINDWVIFCFVIGVCLVLIQVVISLYIRNKEEKIVL